MSLYDAMQNWRGLTLFSHYCRINLAYSTYAKIQYSTYALGQGFVFTVYTIGYFLFPYVGIT